MVSSWHSNWQQQKLLVLAVIDARATTVVDSATPPFLMLPADCRRLIVCCQAKIEMKSHVDFTKTW